MVRRISEEFTVRRRMVKGLTWAVDQISLEAKRNGLGPIDLELNPTGTTEQVAKLELSTVAPAIGNYELLARIDHLKDDRIYIRPMGETHLDFVRIRADHASKICEHCGLKRNRKVTFLLRSERGEVQVGSSCLQAYVGDSDPRRALVQADLFSRARELVAAAVGQEQQDSPRKIRPPAVDIYLAHVAAVIRSEGGFVRKADMDSEHMATALTAMENYRLEQLGEVDEAGRPTWIEVGETEHRYVARTKAEFLEFANRSDLDGYDKRLSTLLGKDLAWPDSQGMLATLFERVFALRKHYGSRYGQALNSKHARWLGEVGDKVDLVATLNGMGKPVDSKYGPQFPHYFTTDDGHLATWFATNIQLSVGARYRVTGEIKRLDRFKRDRITVLTKCRTEALEETADSQ